MNGDGALPLARQREVLEGVEAPNTKRAGKSTVANHREMSMVVVKKEPSLPSGRVSLYKSAASGFSRRAICAGSLKQKIKMML
jgi:hypothetical protein